MKKVLLLLATVLTCVSAWAQNYDGIYTMQVDENQQRGYVVAGEGYADYPVLSDITLNGYQQNSVDAIENGKNWYITTVNEGATYYFYNVAVGKFLVQENSEVNFGDKPYEWKISVNGDYLNIEDVENAGKFLSGGCGRTAAQRPMAFDTNKNDGGAKYTLTSVANGATTFATAIVAADAAIEAANTIVTISYTLTDALGNQYTGTYEGVAEIDEPVITGVAGYSLSNKLWNGNTFTATITFPFPVSSATVTNATMICSFANSNFKWYATGSSIKTCKNTPATNSNVLAHMWAFYPSFSNNAFVFTIKNLFTNTYVYSTSNVNNHEEGAVTLSETASEFTVDANNRLKLSTGKYLSCNSTNTVGEQFIGTWGAHNGTNNTFPSVSYTLTVGPTGFATLYSPVAVALPDDVTVYAVTSATSSKATLTEKEDLPANQGAIIAATEGTYTFTTGEATSDWTGNLLKGSSVDAEITKAGYVLASKDGVTGFYCAEMTDGKFLNNAGKAYLPASAVTAGARCLSFDFGTETAIEGVEGENGNVKTEIYDLAGRRVQGAQKGIFIVNGKKVIK